MSVVMSNVSVTFGTLRGAVPALADVSLQIDEPGIVGVVGRNRAGKTTLMRVLAGYEPRYAGEVTVCGRQAPRAMADSVLAGDRWPGAGGVSLRSLAAQLSLVHPGFDTARFDELLGRFGCDPRGKASSRGSTSAALAALALATRAPLTMLDEPTLGMDAPSRRTLTEVLIEEQLEEPRIILLSTHLIDESADLFERVLVLDAGRVVADADPSELAGAHRRAEGRVEAVVALHPVGRVTRLGNRAEAIVATQPFPDGVRGSTVGLQDVVSALTEQTGAGK